jgi:Tol biopolymer transport system component/tRNA A-37 threonylcarbamoyl transferase component Bud32
VSSGASRVRDLLDEALEKPASERESFLRSACAGDSALREEVRSLLRSLDEAGEFLTPPRGLWREPADSWSGKTVAGLEVGERLGAGGMGVVYKARDTKLGRTVAIKVLPEALLDAPERRTRLEQEARVLASLSHPGIAAIYGLEHLSAQTPVLVLEYVPGATLAEELARGAMAVDEAVQTVCAIASALEAAHGVGVVHRDLKPANIKLVGTTGGVKVLDFGLAKEVGVPQGASPHTPRTPVVTREGEIVGTASYMSPEQARGRAVDKRTDIWSLGCVLYEMLVGTRAFEGETFSDCLAAVLKSEADFSRLPAETPRGVRDVLARCLKKDPEERWRDAGDVRLRLLDALHERPAPTETSAVRGRAWVWAACLGVLGVAGVMWLMRRGPERPGPRDSGVVRFTVDPGAERPIVSWVPHMAFSPSGSHLAYCVETPDGSELRVRSIDDAEGYTVECPRAMSPAFSSDSRFLYYTNLNEGVLWKHDLASRKSSPIASMKGDVVSLVCLPDGSFISSTLWGGAPIYQTFPGGEPARAWPGLRVEQDEVSNWPNGVLPGEEWLLITSCKGRELGQSRIEAVHLKTGERRVVLNRAHTAQFVEPDRMYYSFDGGLYSIGLDVATLRVRGEPTKVADGLTTAGWTGPAYYVASRRGSLAYVPGPTAMGDSQIVTIAPDGAMEVLLDARKGVGEPQFSPDGTKIAFVMVSERADLWLMDLTRTPHPMQRLTRDLFPGSPRWSPDGRYVAIAQNVPGKHESIVLVPADGSDEPRVLLSGEKQLARLGNFTPDGKELLFIIWHENPKPNDDVFAIDVETGAIRPVATSPATEIGAMVSPDGRWLALAHNDTGRWEIDVRPWRAETPRVRVSTNGGYRPVWGKRANPDGTWPLYFQFGMGTWRANLDLGGSVTVREVKQMFEGVILARVDVDPNTERFVSVRDPNYNSRPSRIHVTIVP